MAEDELDGDIGKTIGLETDDCFHIGVITDIDDATGRVTVRTEEGREVIGTFDGVLLNPEGRMSEIMKTYEAGEDGILRRKSTSNWTPVPDPKLSYVARVSAGIVGVGITILVVIMLFSIGDVITQVQSSDWVETEGTVVDARNAQDCSSDGEGGTSCTSYTAVTVAYTFEGRNYTTTDYSMLSNNWLSDAAKWIEQQNVTVYVNPEQPAEALYLSGWDGVAEEIFTGFFFMGIILGGYIGIFVPVWFVYARIQRLCGIEAPLNNEELPSVVDPPEIEHASKEAPSGGERQTDEEKFW